MFNIVQKKSGQKNVWLKVWEGCSCSSSNFQRPTFQRKPARDNMHKVFMWPMRQRLPFLTPAEEEENTWTWKPVWGRSNIQTIFLALRSKCLLRSKQRKTPKLNSWPELQLFMKGEMYLSFIFFEVLLLTDFPCRSSMLSCSAKDFPSFPLITAPFPSLYHCLS